MGGAGGGGGDIEQGLVGLVERLERGTIVSAKGLDLDGSACPGEVDDASSQANVKAHRRAGGVQKDQIAKGEVLFSRVHHRADVKELVEKAGQFPL